jgi:dihydropteroate synthase
MAKTSAETGAASVLNHMRGNFGTMQQDFKPYTHVVEEVKEELLLAARKLIDLGVHEQTICLDPGIGFGKDLQNNLDLISHVETFVETGFPILYGMSRKSYIGKVKGLETSDRLIPTVVSGIFTALGGATVIRVHDVKEAVESLQLLKAFRNESV